MINLSTPTDIMLREMMADKQKSVYWLKKQFGGEKGYEKMRDKLLLESKRSKCNKISDVIEYRSANGNRWMTYECARYYKGAGTSYTEPYAFCFYETLGSVGAFVPVKIGISQESGEDAIIIFTSHFFYQMCERLGVGFRSPQMVRAFHEFIPSMLIELYKDENRVKLMVRLPGSIGWGYKMEGEAHVFEVRTFLMDTQLNGRQRRLTERIRANADKFAYEPWDVMTERLVNKAERGESLDGDIDALKEKFRLTGVDGKNLDIALAVNIAIVNAFEAMGLADPNDYSLWMRHGEVNKQIITDYVLTIDQDDERFMDLLEQCAKNLRLKKFEKAKAYETLRKYGGQG